MTTTNSKRVPGRQRRLPHPDMSWRPPDTAHRFNPPARGLRLRQSWSAAFYNAMSTFFMTYVTTALFARTDKAVAARMIA